MLETLENIHPLLPPLVGLLGLLLGAVIAHLAAKYVLIAAVRAFARKSSTDWDDILVERNVFGRLAQIIPALVVYLGVPFVPGVPENLVTLIRNVATGYMILMLTLALTTLVGAAHTIYERLPMAQHRPLKGFAQLLQLVLWILGGLLIVAAVLDRSPILLLSGFGAMTAILLLVFKDTILSLVASVQLTSQDMVRVGDWIEVPQFGADGDVIDVQLHTVKVQNWDKTITMIPTHRLISDSFRNWRGMQDSGGRRIKRPLYFDMSSIRFLDPAEVERFKRFALLSDYVTNKAAELDSYNQALDESADVNRRRLTNIGTFRAYAAEYLKAHPKIRQNMTLMVRQLSSGPEGLPIEIYCFTATTVWTEYEAIQSDIFDHFFAIVPEFGLRIYQQPAGADLAGLKAGPVDSPS